MRRNTFWLSLLVAFALLAGSLLSFGQLAYGQVEDEEDVVVDADSITTVAALEGTLQAVYEEVSPAVVNIQVQGSLNPSLIVPGA